MQEAFEAGLVPLFCIVGIILIIILWQVLLSAKTIISFVGTIYSLISLIMIIIFSRQMFVLNNYECPKLTILNFPNFDFSFSNSSLGYIYVSFISILWPLAYIYSWAYVRENNETNENRYLFFINISIASALMAGFSANMITLFIFYEILSLSTIPLIGHNLNNRSNKALKKYIFYLVGCSICLWLPGILIINNLTGNIDFSINGQNFNGHSKYIISLAYLLCVFGIAKTAIIPVHSWLIQAMVAGFPVSAVLHAVAVVKLGIFSLLKISIEIFNIDLLQQIIFLKEYLSYFAGIGIIYSGIMAINQETVKKLLAYSTISHMNIMLLSIFTFSSVGIKLAVQYMIIHSFTKITLFYTMGIIYSDSKATKLADFAGSFSRQPLTAAIFTIAGIILTGLPIFYANITKYYILKNTLVLNDYFSFFSMGIGSALTIIYIGKVIINMAYYSANKEILKFNSNFILMKLATFSTLILAINSQSMIELWNILINKLVS